MRVGRSEEREVVSNKCFKCQGLVRRDITKVVSDAPHRGYLVRITACAIENKTRGS